MLSKKSKEFIEWDKDLSGRILEAEEKEIKDRKDDWRMREGVITPSKTPVSPPNKQSLVPFMEGKQ